MTTKPGVIRPVLFFGILAVATILFFYKNEIKPGSIIFSPRGMLTGLWEDYKTNFLENSTGRALDKQQNSITTSEGQSYTMLRAVWMDDRKTFDQAWQWTKDNLNRPEDDLVAWLFGERSDGSYGILAERGGENSASDADTDIALALLFAASRWQDEKYLFDAKPLISDIWELEVVTVNGRPYMAANNIERLSSDKILLNPSYLAPYAYRIFAKADTEHDWNGVIDTSYEIIELSAKANLDKNSSSGLPPDWVYLDRNTGELSAPPTNSLTTNYSFDALRVPFRLALDYKWNSEERAKKILSNFNFLTSEWKKNKQLYASYSHNGTALIFQETPAMYGGALGYFLVADEKNARRVAKKLENLYNPDGYKWKNDLGYYDSNWAWFGLALYYDQLTNLSNL